jgi:hypothetical protein
MAAVGTMKYTFLLSMLLLPGTAAPMQPLRLSDAVGDTIDSAERAELRLFPGIADFRSACAFVRDDSARIVEIEREGIDSTKLLLVLTQGQADRLAYLIDNWTSVSAQAAGDTYARRALERFWTEIESQCVTSESTGAVTPVRQTRPTMENRMFWTMRGGYVGAAVGGVIGAWQGIEYVGMHHTGCSSYPVYHVNYPVFWAASCGTSTLGAVTGYMWGTQFDERQAATASVASERKTYRIAGAILGGLVGPTVGLTAAFLLGGTLYGKTNDPSYSIENGSGFWVSVPALVVGVGLSVDCAYLGYRIGLGLDRRNSARAKP